MSESDNFLARWSRRKRDAGAAAKPDARPDGRPAAAPNENETAPPPSPHPAADTPEPAFDISKLPPIDSIDAASDITPFLAKGVPAALTRAALRRAWVADPAIRDFVGLAENAWDFNAPEAIPGFGPLQMSDEVRRMVVEHFGGAGAGEKSPPPAVVEGSSQDEMTSAKPVPSIETAGEARAAENEGTKNTEEYKQATEIASAEEKQLSLRHRENVAMQEQKSPDQYAGTTSRRGHGGALPT